MHIVPGPLLEVGPSTGVGRMKKPVLRGEPRYNNEKTETWTEGAGGNVNWDWRGATTGCEVRHKGNLCWQEQNQDRITTMKRKINSESNAVECGVCCYVCRTVYLPLPNFDVQLGNHPGQLFYLKILGIAIMFRGLIAWQCVAIDIF